MENGAQRVERLQREFRAAFDGPFGAEFNERLSVVQEPAGIHLAYYGSPFSECFLVLMEALSDPLVASQLVSMSFDGPDEGANGTRAWDISGMAQGLALYPSLREIYIGQTKPSDHNRSVVGSYDEEAILGRILSKAPILDTLVSPSAPDKSFFERGAHPLRYLNVDAGFDHQNFIANFSNSKCFPNLRSMEFGEYAEVYMEDFASRCTPTSDYEKLFESQAFQSVQYFCWRNPVCTDKQIRSLRRKRPKLSFKVLRWSSEWL